MDKFELNEFLNRYLENKEEFFFEYKSFSFWLTTNTDDLPCVNLTNENPISSESIDGLFNVLNIYEKFMSSNEIINSIEKIKVSYKDMKKMLINSNGKFILNENTQIYSYNNGKSKKIVISISFKDSYELLNKFMLDGKTIKQNFENLQ